MEMIREIMSRVKISLPFIFASLLCLCFACADEQVKEQSTVQLPAKENSPSAKEHQPVLVLLNDSINVKLKGDACTDCHAKAFAFPSVHSNTNADALDSLLIPVAREKFLLDCIFAKTKYIAETKEKHYTVLSLPHTSSFFTAEEKKKLLNLCDSMNAFRAKMLVAVQSEKGAGEEIADYEKLRKAVLIKLREDYCSQVYRITICACAPGHFPDHYMEGVYKRLAQFICRTDYKKLANKLKQISFANENDKERLRLQLQQLSLKNYSALTY